MPTKVYNSESGLSTRHAVTVGNLAPNTIYSYEIEVIAAGTYTKRSGSFTTATNPPLVVTARKHSAFMSSYVLFLSGERWPLARFTIDVQPRAGTLQTLSIRVPADVIPHLSNPYVVVDPWQADKNTVTSSTVRRDGDTWIFDLAGRELSFLGTAEVNLYADYTSPPGRVTGGQLVLTRESTCFLDGGPYCLKDDVPLHGISLSSEPNAN